MDGIGTSHIAHADLMLFSGAIVLIIGLKSRHSALSSVFALVSAGVVLGIFLALLLVDNLNGHGVIGLAAVAILLCTRLWRWKPAKLRKAEPV